MSVSIDSMIKEIYGCRDFPLFRVVNVTFLVERSWMVRDCEKDF